MAEQPRLVWEGDPFAVASNRRLVAVRQGQFAKTVQRSTYVAAAATMVEAFTAQWSGAPLESVVTVHIVTYWPRKRGSKGARPVGVGLGVGDVDATTKSVLDALQKAGVLVDDGQVRLVVAEKGYDKARPRVEVEVVEEAIA